MSRFLNLRILLPHAVSGSDARGPGLGAASCLRSSAHVAQGRPAKVLAEDFACSQASRAGVRHPGAVALTAVALVALVALAAAVAVPFLATAGRYELRSPLATPTPSLLKPVPPIIGPVQPEMMIQEAVIVAPTIAPRPTPTPAEQESP